MMSQTARPLWALALAAGLAGLAGCAPTYPKCNGDNDCKSHNEFCVNGQCQQCRDAKDCKPGQACNQGRCEAAKTSCTEDGQCPAGQSCIDGQCRPCTSDSECGPDGKCSNGRCERAMSSRPETSRPSGGESCTLDPIYFDFNEYVLTSEATSTIDRDVECLKKNPQKPVSLVGHADPRGTEEFNLALSDRRAQSVKERLQRVGIAPARLKTVARGKMDANGSDETGWAKDRRVEFQW